MHPLSAAAALSSNLALTRLALFSKGFEVNYGGSQKVGQRQGLDQLHMLWKIAPK